MKISNNEGKDGFFFEEGHLKGREYFKLAQISPEPNGKCYLIYTDRTTDENGLLNVYAGILEQKQALELNDLENDEDIKAVNAFLEKLNGGAYN